MTTSSVRKRAAILAVVALGLAGCAGKNAGGIKLDRSLETLVPADTVLAVGTRLDSLLQTPLYEKNFADRALPQLEQFTARTGLDPRKDLAELLYAFDGRRGVLLARGNFGQAKTPANFEKQGVTRTSYKGVNLYGDERNAVALLSPAVAAAGEIDALHSLIDRRKSSGLPPALAGLIAEIPAEAQFWAAYSGGPIHLPFDDASPLANLNKLVASIQTGTVYFDLRDGLNGLARADCSTDQNADQVAGALRALIGIGRLSVPKNHPEIERAYDALRVTVEARRVKLYIAVPQTIVDQFLGVWMRR